LRGALNDKSALLLIFAAFQHDAEGEKFMVWMYKNMAINLKLHRLTKFIGGQLLANLQSHGQKEETTFIKWLDNEQWAAAFRGDRG
jgi:hypothetical protein